jgi:lon protease
MKLSKRDYVIVGLVSVLVLAGFIPLSFYKLTPGPSETITKNLNTLSVYANKANVYEYIGSRFQKESELISVPDISENKANAVYTLAETSAKKSALDLAQKSYTEKHIGYMVIGIKPDSKFKQILQEGDIITAINGESVVGKSLDEIGKTKPFKNKTVTFEFHRDNKIFKKSIKVADETGSLMLSDYINYESGDIKLDDDTTLKQININGSSVGLTYATYYYLKLNNYELKEPVAMTGTIDNGGNVGPIEGIREKIIGAHKAHAKYVFVPERNYADAMATKKEFGYKLDIYPVKSLADTVNYLNDLELIMKG